MEKTGNCPECGSTIYCRIQNVLREASKKSQRDGAKKAERLLHVTEIRMCSEPCRFSQNVYSYHEIIED